MPASSLVHYRVCRHEGVDCSMKNSDAGMLPKFKRHMHPHVYFNMLESCGTGRESKCSEKCIKG